MPAASTRRAYSADWRRFAEWCEGRGLDALPAAQGTVVLFLVTEIAHGLSAGTIARRCAAINFVHTAANHAPPAKGLAVATLRAALDGEPAEAKAPLSVDQIAKLVATLDLGRPAGFRDRAILTVGWATGLRRGELMALDAADVIEGPDGICALFVSSSGRDRLANVPQTIGPISPAGDLRSWLSVSGITSGPIFRPIDRHDNMADARLSDRAVAEIVKRTAARAGLDPALYSGHSLRRGRTIDIAEGSTSVEALRMIGYRALNSVDRAMKGDA